MPQYIEGKTQVATGEYLKTIHRVFFRRIWLIILIGVVTAVATFVTSKIIKPVYEAQTSIRVQQTPMILSERGATLMAQRSLEAEAMWVESRFIVEDVMKKLGIGAEAKNPKEYLRILEKLQENIEVEPFPASNVLRITVNWYEPELTKQIANSLADVFIEKYESFNQAQAKESRKFIESQLDIMKVKLDEAHSRLSNFQKREGIFTISHEVENLSRQLTTLQTRRAETEMEIKLANMKIEQIRTQIDISEEELEKYKNKVSGLPYQEYDETSLLMQTLRSRVARLEADVASLSSLYTDKYPPLVRKRTELAECKKKLNRELSGIISETDLQNKDPYYQNMIINLVQNDMQIRAMEEQKKALDDLIRKAQLQAGNLPDKQVAYAEVTRDKSVREDLYTLLLAKLQEARIKENANVWDIRVFDRAYVPYEPIRPRPVRNTIFGAVIGLLLGVGLSMVIEYFDDSFRTVEDVESFLNISVLAAIPELKRKHIKKTDEDQ